MKYVIQSIASVLSIAVLPVSAQAFPVAPTLKGDLITLEGKKIKTFDDTKLTNTKYFAVYYSASWYVPCRYFTPKLVEWYNKNKPAHPNFELIFVSSDNSESEMEDYMSRDSMPWPALAFTKTKGNNSVTRYKGPGITGLVFIDADGKVLSNSFEGATYGDSHKVLEVLMDIKKTLGADPAAAVPVVGGSGMTTAPANMRQPAGL